MSTAVYVHIPFCAVKCKYCDFLSTRADEDVIETYFKALYSQIAMESRKINDGVSSVYIGGGTPSFVDVKYIEELMRVLKDRLSIPEHAEISMEANPASSLDREKMFRYKHTGINRLSFGLQSTHKKHLKSLGRIHSLEDFILSYENARAAGFDNINVDLIHSLPGQSFEEYEKSLRFTAEMRPEHISAYSLIIEEGTEFYSLYAEDEQKKLAGETPHFLCTEETELNMLKLTETLLKEFGYDRYEISNYARDNKECRHNLVYWERGNYFGFGLGAASLIGNMRFSVTKDMKRYIKLLEGVSAETVYEDVCHLNRKDEINETMMLGLRLTKGVDLDKINKRYHVNMLKDFQAMFQSHLEHGLLKLENGRIRLTEKGFELANVVMKDFV